MKKILLTFLLAFSLAGAAEKRFVVLPCLGIGGYSDAKGLERLKSKVREIATSMLPLDSFILLSDKEVDENIEQEEFFNACAEEGACFGNLVGAVNADYGAWCKVNKLSSRLELTFELYDAKRKGTIYTKLFNNYDAAKSRSIDDLLKIIEKEAPEAFRKIPGVAKTPAAAFAGGISGVQSAVGGYQFEGGKRYVANIATKPKGAALSFNGVPDSRCAKTPCKIELPEGSVRIVANLEQYEIADTTVSIRQNNQSINIQLNSNIGVLEVKPAYLEGIGKNEQWDLAINGEAASSLENELSPGKYNVLLEHGCYEDVKFNAGINKGKREVFDMASHIKLKMGGLVLSAESGGEPVSEPVFANGKQIGETPFSGSVPICAKIEIGSERERVGIALKHNEKVAHTVSMGIYLDEPGKKTWDIGANISKISKELKSPTWVTIGLVAAGIGMGVYGVLQNSQLDLHRNDYNALKQGDPEHRFDSSAKNAEDAQSNRNIGYILGGALLASGITVYFFF